VNYNQNEPAPLTMLFSEAAAAVKAVGVGNANRRTNGKKVAE